MKSPKQILIAIDKFKGTANQFQLSEMITSAIQKIAPRTKTQICIAADGGDGTLTVFAERGWAEEVLTAAGPLGIMRETQIYISPDGKKIAIELAEICGIKLLDGGLAPLQASTLGLGEVLSQVIERSPSEIIIGLGGSASNDGGLGILQGLGVNIYDKNKKEVSLGLDGLKEVHSIDRESLDKFFQRIAGITVTVLADVDSPLTGEFGAIKLFGKQKGVRAQESDYFERVMQRWGELLEKELAKPIMAISGAGAAGGSGAALVALFNATIINGSSYLLDLQGYRQRLAGVDFVITGEGRVDESTFQGKSVFHVVRQAAALKVPILVLAGQVQDSAAKKLKVISSDLEVISISKFVGYQCKSIDQIQRAIDRILESYLRKKFYGNANLEDVLE